MTNYQVAKRWAEQTHEHGKSSNGNASFRGKLFYSYRTPVANFIAPNFVLVTSRTYSITTSGKHMPAIRSALNYCNMIAVYIVNPATAYEHDANLADFAERIAIAQNKAKRSLKAENKRHYALRALALVQVRNMYCEHFNLPIVGEAA